MPFDFQPQPTLDPSVRDLPPRQRLERLRDWLANGGPGKDAWDYTNIMNDCGTIGCAIGWYDTLVGLPGTINESNSKRASNAFGISGENVHKCFYYAETSLNKFVDDVTPQDVAKVIDMVLDGKIK